MTTFFIVSSTSPAGAHVHTRHYSLLSVLAEMTWRALAGHTEIYSEDNHTNLVYVL